MDKPGAQIMSFVHWIVWGMNIHRVVSYMIHSNTANLKKIEIFAILTFLIISLTLIPKLRTGQMFEASNLLHKNPYKITLEVIKLLAIISVLRIGVL